MEEISKVLRERNLEYEFIERGKRRKYRERNTVL